LIATLGESPSIITWVGKKTKKLSTSLMESARFSGVISRGQKRLVNREWNIRIFKAGPKEKWHEAVHQFIQAIKTRSGSDIGFDGPGRLISLAFASHGC
jgi:hypothetical protein